MATEVPESSGMSVEVHERIWRIYGKGRNGGITAVGIQDESGACIKVTHHLEMEQACMVENHLRFFQSMLVGTPFTTQPYWMTLGTRQWGTMQGRSWQDLM